MLIMLIVKDTFLGSLSTKYYHKSKKRKYRHSCSYLFFANRLSAPKIERSLRDGSDRRVIVDTSRIVVPEALTVDRANEHLYWSDSFQDRVERVGYDGSGRKVILKKTWVGVTRNVRVHINKQKTQNIHGVSFCQPIHIFMF